MKVKSLIKLLQKKYKPDQEVRGDVMAVSDTYTWHEMLSRFHEVPTSWYFVNESTDEILAWINKKSEHGLTYKYKERYFVSLEGAKRAAEKDVIK